MALAASDRWPLCLGVFALALHGCAVATRLGLPTDASLPAVARPAFKTVAAAEAYGLIDPGVIQRLRKVRSVDCLVSWVATPAAPGVILSDAAVTQRFAGEQARKQATLKHLGREQLTVLRDYQSLPLAYVRIRSERALLELLNDPAVLGVSENVVHHRTVLSSTVAIGKPRKDAWPHAGSGVAVAVLDDGVDYGLIDFGQCLSPGPSCSVVYAADFAPPDGQRADAGGHGSNVAAIVVAVAPSVKILALDVFDGPKASTDVIISAIDYVLLHRLDYNVRAINMSLGTDQHFTQACLGNLFSRDPFAIAFTRARSLNVLPVVSAGNDGFPFVDGISHPACAPGAIAVGAVYDTNLGSVNFGKKGCTDLVTGLNVPACFSQSGGLLSIWAPGVSVEAGGQVMTGTSQAAPHVSGAIAVLASVLPGATADQLASALSAFGPSVTDTRNGIVRKALHIPSLAAGLGSIPNDTIATALAIQASSGAAQQYTIGASDDTEGAPARSTVWYSWVAPGTGTARFDLAGSDFPAALTAYGGSAIAPAQIASNLFTLNDEVSFPVTAATRYWIAVGGRQAPSVDTGFVHFSWNITPVAGFGSQDSRASALIISGTTGTVSGSNLNATHEPGEPDHCANDGGASVWFSWTAPATGRYQFASQGTWMRCVAAYLGSSPTNWTAVAGDGWNDPPPADARTAAFNATAGTTYHLVVDGILCEDGPPVCLKPSQGVFTLTWQPIP